MNNSSASLILAAHLAVLSSLSFGGFPTVLPDVHDFTVARGWVTDQEFANFFAVSQIMPGPNMILMMSFIGLKVGGIAGAAASALATFGPPCAMYYLSYRLWDRFREMPWQRIVRRGLAPLTIGLVIAGGGGGDDVREAAQSALDPHGRRCIGRARVSLAASDFPALFVMPRPR